MLQNIEILFEDNHLIAVNKPVGELVQTDKFTNTSIEEAVKKYIKEKYNKKGNVFLGITHRIDRPVSGLVLMAKSAKALTRINTMLKEHQINKKYWAITSNIPTEKSGKLVHYIKRNEKNNISKAFNKEVKDSKIAELEYNVIDKSDKYFLIEINLITGRHHQIRAQLSAIGCPIKGDLKYGSKRSNPEGGISLHSREINFIHPVTKMEICIVAPVPNEKLWNYFQEKNKKLR